MARKSATLSLGGPKLIAKNLILDFFNDFNMDCSFEIVRSEPPLKVTPKELDQIFNITLTRYNITLLYEDNPY